MKKFLLAIALLFYGFIVNAQIIYDGSQFKLSTISENLPLISLPIGTNPGSLPKKPGHAVFVLEYGDGYFTTELDPFYQYTRIGDMNAVLSLSGRYDTIKPPRVFAKNISVGTADGLGSISQSLLGTNEYVRLTPIARSINVRDEMLFILTYKIQPGNTPDKLKLFYNQSGNIVFNPIVSSVDRIFESKDNTGALDIVSRVRSHFGEVLTIENAPATMAGLTGTGYQNVLSWEVPSDLSVDKEYNIFVTLRTGDNLPTSDAVNIEAAFTFKTNTQKGGVSQQAGPAIADTSPVFSSLALPASLNPHDPNYISASPRCIVKGPGFERVKYQIHFQNEGGGAAHRLKIKVHLDARLKEAINKLNVDSFRVTAGKKLATNLTYKKLNDSTLILDIVFPKSGSASDADSSLSCNRVPFYVVNELTMGDVYFHLAVPKFEEADLAATAEIYFYNQGNVEMDPVFTRPDTLFIRTTCSGNLFPLITPITNVSENDSCKSSCKSACCCTFLGLCWCWWLVIVLVIAFLIWFLIRRRRRRGDNNNS